MPYAKTDNPQTINLYAYVGDNPESRTDADGHDAILLNDSRVAYGEGHNAALVGNDKEGRTYFGKPGNKENFHTKFPTLHSFQVSSESARFDRAARVSTRDNKATSIPAHTKEPNR